MIISIASGKGGTGKTTIAVNLALSLSNVQFIDCDVEEPNAHLFLKPEMNKKISACIPVPEVDEEKCTYCGKCKEVCAYNAFAVFKGNSDKDGSIIVFPHLCHGCGSCKLFCPENAIKEVDREIGIIEIGNAKDIEFVHGKLNIGEPMAPPLIRQVKDHIKPEKTVIIDAPPGTSCPVVETVKASDYCILVTEPTPFGLNDLILAVEVLKKMKIPFGIVINRSDIGDNHTEEYCEKEKIPILMKIPFKREIAFAYSKGISIIEALPVWKENFQDLFSEIKCNITKNTDEDNSSLNRGSL
ncbi:MAG: ATP-binding protein [Candidatus Aureabacteria bacterium]|nr:ATP-binding protein [Candidatus Auribacterota bacterium]